MAVIENMDKRQSVLIDAMRFPLIVLVVFVHVLSFELAPVELTWTGMNAYVFVSEMISHNLGRIAVPSFFLFSGYFFFRKMERWHIGFYLTQLRKRVRTLLIPYFLWNVLTIAASVAVGYAFVLLNLGNSDPLGIFRQHNLYELFYGMPANFPLWYLRDLMCMTLLTPLFYIFFRYTKLAGMLLLLALYLSMWETGIAGLSMTAFFYFGAGAYLGICKKNMLQLSAKIPVLSIVLSAALLVAVTCFNGMGHFYELIVRIFIPLAIIASINIANKSVDKKVFREKMIKLSPTVFFIYALHGIYIQNWIKGFFYRILSPDSGGAMLLAYILIPLFTLVACLIAYYLWKRFLPVSFSLFTGGRINFSKNNPKI